MLRTVVDVAMTDEVCKDMLGDGFIDEPHKWDSSSSTASDVADFLVEDSELAIPDGLFININQNRVTRTQ